ncbi:MAG: hypothetical protein Q7S57_03375 [bacterium]|nr:hypothetical protein [bacterium]
MTRLTKKSLFATIVLLALFLTVLLRNEPKLQTPLINMEIENAVPKNTTIISNVPIIKDELKDNVTKGNYILQGNIVIPEGKTVQVEPDTVFYANRDAKITVHGKLIANNVTWQSNQAYNQRRYWYGLTAENNGEINLENCQIQDATTAVTTLNGGKATISGVFTNNVVGVSVLEKGKVKIQNLQINEGTVGILTLGGNTAINNATFTGLTDGLRIFHDSMISINKPTFTRIQRNTVRYLAEPNITITNIIDNSASSPTQIFDGKNQPTHLWQGKEYKTGIVSI